MTITDLDRYRAQMLVSNYLTQPSTKIVTLQAQQVQMLLAMLTKFATPLQKQLTHLRKQAAELTEPTLRQRLQLKNKSEQLQMFLDLINQLSKD